MKIAIEDATVAESAAIPHMKTVFSKEDGLVVADPAVAVDRNSIDTLDVRDDDASKANSSCPEIESFEASFESETNSTWPRTRNIDASRDGCDDSLENVPPVAGTTYLSSDKRCRSRSPTHKSIDTVLTQSRQLEGVHIAGNGRPLKDSKNSNSSKALSNRRTSPSNEKNGRSSGGELRERGFTRNSPAFTRNEKSTRKSRVSSTNRKPFCTTVGLKSDSNLDSKTQKRSNARRVATKSKPSGGPSIFERLHSSSNDKALEGKKRREEMAKKQRDHFLYRSGKKCKETGKVSAVRGSKVYYQGMMHVLKKELAALENARDNEGFETRLNLPQMYEYSKTLKKLSSED